MSYAAVNTKAVTVYARYLKPEVPLRILEAGNVKDGLAILEQSWGLELSDDPHLLEINVKMVQKVYDTLIGFHYYLQGQDRIFFNALLKRYEMQDLKRIFRAVYHEENVDIVRNSLLALDPEILPREQTVGPDELFKALDATPYGRMLSAYEGVSRDRILFYIEMELDKSYYEDLMKEAQKLPKKYRKSVMAMLNRQVDLLNILYIYRGKKTYDIMKSEMENFAIRGGNIPRKLLDSWIYADDVEALVRSVRASSFAFLFETARDNHMTDVLAARDLAAMYLKQYQQGGPGPARIVALSNYYDNRLDGDLPGLRKKFMNILNEEVRLQEIVMLVGEDVLPDKERFLLIVARLIKDAFLQQNAFNDIDQSVPLEKQFAMMEVIDTLYEEGKVVLEQGISIEEVKDDALHSRIVNMKYNIANDDSKSFTHLINDIQEHYREIRIEYGIAEDEMDALEIEGKKEADETDEQKETEKEV